MKLEIDLGQLWSNVNKMGRDKAKITLEPAPVNTGGSGSPNGSGGSGGPEGDGGGRSRQKHEPAVPIEGGALSEESFKIVEGPGGLLQKDGQQIMMYMPGHYPERFEKALQDGNDGNRMHVAFCIHLEKMKQNGNYDTKYFATQRIDDQFSIHDNKSDRKGHAALKVCKYCLNKLNYDGYAVPGRGKGAIFKDFSFEAFFERYASFFSSHPLREVPRTPQEKGYTKDWAEVSRRYRASRNYCCEECTVDLNDYQYLLHSHHVNANKQDNRNENLRALCIDCHSKQPYHDHMLVSVEDRHLIAQLRQRQNMPAPANWSHVFDLADPGMNGVMHFLQHNHAPIPVVGQDIQDESEAVVATLELAWPTAQLAIAITVEDAVAARQQGWNIFSVEQALATPEHVLGALRQSRFT
ncbi:HNH endonuclease [Cobetia sp. 14N.309.X.WAT.E.A4]|uniref:HNH endonuclease n=1 Tax=Cobetia sp. 14N.309.X.WAT.E.A4 TaxID=2998323 RepID=UPI0025B01107|nr:HNH endonuclease [Cobetia sp. 14N.309.X.WAT.E.A4]MDN2655395.1 HNH endonuclease [Cobetia sp. 14N.309.X.WAT.E.A4]